MQLRTSRLGQMSATVRFTQRLPLQGKAGAHSMELEQAWQYEAAKQRNATALCALVFRNWKASGQFSMVIKHLPVMLHLTQAELDAAIEWARNNGWLRRFGNRVELRAAGIYMAKRSLNFPR